jgi:hypothetical protein
MDKLVRFSDYDVFGCIASGLTSFVIWDIVFASHFVLGAQWTVPTAAMTIAGAYIIGQILASPSGWLIERQFVHRVLFRPSVVLLDAKPITWRWMLKRTVLQDYYTPLDIGLRRRIQKRAAAERGEGAIGEALFWCAYPIAKRDSMAYGRMSGFLTLYGFCRNMAFICLLGAVLITVDALIEAAHMGSSPHVWQQLHWALLSTLVAAGMLHRYLKFLRLYSVEVFVTYSEAPATLAKPTS